MCSSSFLASFLMPLVHQKPFFLPWQLYASFPLAFSFFSFLLYLILHVPLIFCNSLVLPSCTCVHTWINFFSQNFEDSFIFLSCRMDHSGIPSWIRELLNILISVLQKWCLVGLPGPGLVFLQYFWVVLLGKNKMCSKCVQ